MAVSLVTVATALNRVTGFADSYYLAACARRAARASSLTSESLRTWSPKLHCQHHKSFLSISVTATSVVGDSLLHDCIVFELLIDL